MRKELYKRDAKGKIRVSTVEVVRRVNDTFLIERKSGILEGKLREEVDIIEEGKANRTTSQQAILKFDSVVNKLQDRGYKTKEQYCNNAETEFTWDLIPLQSTSAEGDLRPMLASPMKANFKLDKSYIVQYKLNGVRCTMFKKDGKVVARSRAGKSYDIPTTLIRADLTTSFFNTYPNGFLDGELYIHGVPLQTISGYARKEVVEPLLEYHIYDGLIDINNNEANGDRILSLEIQETNKIKLSHNFLVSDTESLLKIEEDALSDGYEGLIIRDVDAKYAFGKRSTALLKLKKFIDEEFIVVGYEYGKRKEDLVFICTQEEGKEFKVKMTGTSRFKENLILEKCVGKKLTVKYFERTAKNIPFHGVGLNFRDYE